MLFRKLSFFVLTPKQDKLYPTPSPKRHFSSTTTKLWSDQEGRKVCDNHPPTPRLLSHLVSFPRACKRCQFPEENSLPMKTKKKETKTRNKTVCIFDGAKQKLHFPVHERSSFNKLRWGPILRISVANSFEEQRQWMWRHRIGKAKRWGWSEGGIMETFCISLAFGCNTIQSLPFPTTGFYRSEWSQIIGWY